MIPRTREASRVSAILEECAFALRDSADPLRSRCHRYMHSQKHTRMLRRQLKVMDDLSPALQIKVLAIHTLADSRFSVASDCRGVSSPQLKCQNNRVGY